MLKKALCLLTILVFCFTRLRFREDANSWDKSFIKATKSYSTSTTKCLVIWLLIHAARLNDPHKIVQAYDLLKRDFDWVPEGGVAQKTIESLLWLRKIHAAQQLLSVSHVSSNQKQQLVSFYALIGDWMGKENNYDVQVASMMWVSSLPWFAAAVSARAFDNLSNKENAIDRYRKALSAMPNWMPEAREVWNRLNQLRNS